mmetsp:Transcript_39246/g.79268  ORF Transcript_39246/g.79268 Transcript_39246/m.79268 type:complete len:279 (+) Transcript_39246:434-1270(+)
MPESSAGSLTSTRSSAVPKKRRAPRGTASVAPMPAASGRPGARRRRWPWARSSRAPRMGVRKSCASVAKGLMVSAAAARTASTDSGMSRLAKCPRPACAIAIIRLRSHSAPGAKALVSTPRRWSSSTRCRRAACCSQSPVVRPSEKRKMRCSRVRGAPPPAPASRLSCAASRPASRSVASLAASLEAAGCNACSNARISFLLPTPMRSNLTEAEDPTVTSVRRSPSRRSRTTGAMARLSRSSLAGPAMEAEMSRTMARSCGCLGSAGALAGAGTWYTV